MERIRAKIIVLLIILLSTCVLLGHQPGVRAQSSSNIVNLSLNFHNYSLLLSDPNGSFCVYNGADGSSNSVNPTQANLISEISGQQVVSGFSVTYWSSVIIWAIKLPMDLNVDGTVKVNAYISSNFELSGFFSGGGYGMGLVDLDQNNNLVQEFITQAPYTIGANPFTSTPTEYSVSTNVNYIFKAGHSIGFAVGLGATAQGFSATVYFDSASYSSGATLPVVDTSQYQSFTENSQIVGVSSDSAISNFQCNSATDNIQFNAEGINYTTGFCNVSIPKSLMQKPFDVSSASQQITSSVTENSTYYQVYFTHTRTAAPIQITGTANEPTTQPTILPTSAISASPTTPSSSPSTTIPEYPFLAIIALFAVSTLTVVFRAKRKKVLAKLRG